MNALGLSKILVVSGVSSTSLYTSVVGNKFLRENLTSFMSSIQPLISSPSSSTKSPEIKVSTKSKNEKSSKDSKSTHHPCDPSASSLTDKLFRAVRPCRTKALQVNLKPEKLPQQSKSRRRR